MMRRMPFHLQLGHKWATIGPPGEDQTAPAVCTHPLSSVAIATASASTVAVNRRAANDLTQRRGMTLGRHPC